MADNSDEGKITFWKLLALGFELYISTASTQMHSRKYGWCISHVTLSFSLSIFSIHFSLNAISLGKIKFTLAFFLELLKHSGTQHIMLKLRTFKGEFSFSLKTSAFLDKLIVSVNVPLLVNFTCTVWSGYGNSAILHNGQLSYPFANVTVNQQWHYGLCFEFFCGIVVLAECF